MNTEHAFWVISSERIEGVLLHFVVVLLIMSRVRVKLADCKPLNKRDDGLAADTNERRDPCIHYRTPYRGTVRLTTVRPYCTDAGRGVRAETLGETATTPLAGFTQLEAPNLQSLSMNEGFSASHSAF